jgi:hypothetical protein
MAKAHEVRVNKLARNFELIEARVKRGDVVLDKRLLMKMSPAEQNEFKRSLNPEGLRKMEKLQPDLFRPGAMMRGRTSLNFFDFDIDSQRIGCAVKSAGIMLVDGIGDFFVRDAEARYFAPCVGPCVAKNWPACVSCVVAAGPKGIDAWNSFVHCWNGCRGWWWKKRWCRVKCLAKFIAKLA